MSTLGALLDEVCAAGATLAADDGDLVLDIPGEPSREMLDGIRANKVGLLRILRAGGACVPDWPAIGQRCPNCRVQWWWSRVDRQGRETGGWQCGACIPPPSSEPKPRKRDWRWTWSGPEGRPIPIRADLALAREVGR